MKNSCLYIQSRAKSLLLGATLFAILAVTGANTTLAAGDKCLRFGLGQQTSGLALGLCFSGLGGLATGFASLGLESSKGG